jgi:hypothetical protein
MPDGGTKPTKKMSDEELLQLIRAYELAALGSSVAAGATISSVIFPSNTAMTTLEIDRYNALNTYFARPLGNEIENRSQIVLPELRDTVEWIMPQLMRMFTQSKQICRFDAEGAQDRDQAQLETEAVNDIFLKQNNGFFILHDFFKDALLLRNGYVTVDWVEETISSVERYSGLDQDGVAKVMKTGKDETVDVIEQNEYPMPQEITALIPQGLPPTIFDLKLRRTKKVGRVKVQCIPPEEMRVSPRTRGNLEDCPFAQHFTQETRSDLLADGHSRDLVDSLTTGRPNWFEMDALARNQVVDQLSVENPADHAMEEIEVRRNVMRVDRDGDGLAELRSVLVAGNDILDDEEIEETPYASCVPKRMPHRHTGISLYDELADLQIIKTQLFRQGLDNLALANNQRTGVDWQTVNIDDLLTSRPGGIVRTKGPPQNSIMPIVQPSNMLEQVVPVMQYVDTLRTMRTGVGEQQLGLDMDALQDVTKGGQLAGLSAASLKIELIARFLAEGVKNIFEKIRNCIVRHQDKSFQLERAGKWIEIDPTDWKPRRNKMSVNVGLGSGNREEARANVAMLGTMQGQLVPMGLIEPKHGYATFKRGCEVLGFENPQEFALDPASDEYKQKMASQPAPPPDPKIQVAQITAQSAAAKEKAQTERTLVDAKVELMKAQTQQVHEKTLEDQKTAHDVLQQHQDRQTEVMGHDKDITLALIRVIGMIEAAKQKAAASADVGGDVKKDLGEVDVRV